MALSFWGCVIKPGKQPTPLKRRADDAPAPGGGRLKGQSMESSFFPTTNPNRARHLRCLGSISWCSAALSDHLIYHLPPLGTWPSASGTSIYIGIPTGADTRPEDVAHTLWEAAIFRLTTLENEKDVARKR